MYTCQLVTKYNIINEIEVGVGTQRSIVKNENSINFAQLRYALVDAKYIESLYTILCEKWFLERINGTTRLQYFSR